MTMSRRTQVPYVHLYLCIHAYTIRIKTIIIVSARRTRPINRFYIIIFLRDALGQGAAGIQTTQKTRVAHCSGAYTYALTTRFLFLLRFPTPRRGRLKGRKEKIHTKRIGYNIHRHCSPFEIYCIIIYIYIAVNTRTR